MPHHALQRRPDGGVTNPTDRRAITRKVGDPAWSAGTGMVAAILCRRSQARLAREEACDNAVLGQDVVASDYAALLLSLGVGRDSVTATLAPALGLAHHSTLGIRLCALLDETRDRSLPSRGKIGLTAALGSVMLLSLIHISDPTRPY